MLNKAPAVVNATNAAMTRGDSRRNASEGAHRGNPIKKIPAVIVAAKPDREKQEFISD
jgi:hypothetical protein